MRSKKQRGTAGKIPVLTLLLLTVDRKKKNVLTESQRPEAPRQRHLVSSRSSVKLQLACLCSRNHQPLLHSQIWNWPDWLESGRTLHKLVCFCRICQLRQPCECAGSYSGHERLPDRDEEVESPTKETEGCQPPLLTPPTFSIHCSSTGEARPARF